MPRSTPCPSDAPASERIRLALRAHLRVVAEQLDVATVFTREWRYLEDERREAFVAERRRYEERIRELFREARDLGELRSDLDLGIAGLLFLSSANWAYTWLTPGRDTDELADRFYRAARRRDARLLDRFLKAFTRDGGFAVPCAGDSSSSPKGGSMPSRRLLPSPALVVAGVALLFALTGSAFALGQKSLPRNPGARTVPYARWQSSPVCRGTASRTCPTRTRRTDRRSVADSIAPARRSR